MVYSPEMVALLQQLRSRIHAEFGVKIRLVDPELLASLGQMGQKSRDPFTRKTIVQVMELADIPYKLDEKATKATPQPPAGAAGQASDSEGTEMTYRGTKIYREKPFASQPSGASEAMPSPVRKQMYRGQVVNK